MTAVSSRRNQKIMSILSVYCLSLTPVQIRGSYTVMAKGNLREWIDKFGSLFLYSKVTSSNEHTFPFIT